MQSLAPLALSSAKSHEDAEVTGMSLLQRAERAGTAHPGEEKAQECA